MLILFILRVLLFNIFQHLYDLLLREKISSIVQIIIEMVFVGEKQTTSFVAFHLEDGHWTNIFDFEYIYAYVLFLNFMIFFQSDKQITSPTYTCIPRTKRIFMRKQKQQKNWIEMKYVCVHSELFTFTHNLMKLKLQTEHPGTVCWAILSFKITFTALYNVNIYSLFNLVVWPPTQNDRKMRNEESCRKKMGKKLRIKRPKKKKRYIF